MRKLTLTLVSFMLIMMTSCEKDEITPSQPTAKEQLKGCRTCEGSWDLAKGSTP